MLLLAIALAPQIYFHTIPRLPFSNPFFPFTLLLFILCLSQIPVNSSQGRLGIEDWESNTEMRIDPDLHPLEMEGRALNKSYLKLI